MTAKCGPIVSWHWAHAARPRCDSWWENETEWHRNWKGRFPVHQQEVIHYAPDGEKHIADVKTARGTVVELQNSPIALAELSSRENFYGDMIWIVNGDRFRSNFHVLTRLPPPDSELANDLYVVKPPRHPVNKLGHGPIMVRNRHVTPSEFGATIDLGGSSSWDSPTQFRDHARDAINEIAELKSPFWFLDWRRPHAAWLSAKKPVYFDFGGQSLLRLHRFQERYLCVEDVHSQILMTRLLAP